MMTNTINGRYDHFIALGTSGKAQDVDALMQTLVGEDNMATSRLD
ncbi:MAG: hypothetical protein R3C44_11770 [Chloroflexota bacterium]